MKTVKSVILLFAMSGVVDAHEVVKEESDGSWTSYEIKCDSGETRYIIKNSKGYWARGKVYGNRKDAIAVACQS